ncbi:MAG TPA: hypothetical protein VFP50_18280 [Anaeromyxobacteraceae bacterium]|nr:hypothetical protein [Anaeromyxobacteraceae bacterium]
MSIDLSMLLLVLAVVLITRSTLRLRHWDKTIHRGTEVLDLTGHRRAK